MSTTPLHGIKVIEFAGLAPGPFAGLVLADWGASIIRIDRADQEISSDVLCRSKRSLAVNIKTDSGHELVRKLISESDVVIDPFRPGVLEKLGLGPDVFLGPGGWNNRLVFARLAGFQRTGSYKDMAGHDINYLALSGVLSMLPGSAPGSPPSFPLNLLADFAGGGLMCALGILLALLSRTSSGKGQIVEVDMVSGTRYLSSYPLIHSLLPASPMFGTGKARGTRILDGGAPFYGVYTCKDGLMMSVGCLEAQFFDVFIGNLLKALPKLFIEAQSGWLPTSNTRADVNEWPRLRIFLERAFEEKTRDEWAEVFKGTDSCAVPVLSPTEAAALSSSIPQPHPSLRRTPASLSIDAAMLNDECMSLKPGAHTEEILDEFGISTEEKRQLIRSGTFGRIEKAKL